jgi:hypothetical protein
MEKAEIKASIKALGLKTTDVTVRHNHSTITFTVRSMAALDKIAAIKDFAYSLKSVYYDEVSGEILGGGNTFVYVIPSDELIDFVCLQLADFNEDCPKTNLCLQNSILNTILSLPKIVGYFCPDGNDLQILVYSFDDSGLQKRLATIQFYKGENLSKVKERLVKRSLQYLLC